MIIRTLFKIIAVPIAALAGNWLGGELRTNLTGQRAQSIRFSHTTAEGRTITNTPVVTKFYPALFASALGKPRWLYAFLGGLVTGGLVDDRPQSLQILRPAHTTGRIEDRAPVLVGHCCRERRHLGI